MERESWEKLYVALKFSPSFRAELEAQLPADFERRFDRKLGPFFLKPPMLEPFELQYNNNIGFVDVVLVGRTWGYNAGFAWVDKAGDVVRPEDDVSDRELQIWWYFVEDKLLEDVVYSKPRWAKGFGFPIEVLERMPDSEMSLELTFGRALSNREASKLVDLAQDVLEAWRGPGTIHRAGPVTSHHGRTVVLAMDFGSSGFAGAQSVLRVLAGEFEIESLRIS